MSRLKRIDVEDWDPVLRDTVKGEDMPSIARSTFDIVAHRPPLAMAFAQLFGTFRQTHILPDRLLELVRLRMAFHNQCRTCMAIRYQHGINDGVDESLVCSLSRPVEAPGLTAAEREALAYTDLFMSDHLAIGDDHVERLRGHFTEAEIVELNVWLAMSGFGRMAAVFHMTEELPDYFRDEQASGLTPWNSPHVVLD